VCWLGTEGYPCGTEILPDNRQQMLEGGKLLYILLCYAVPTWLGGFWPKENKTFNCEDIERTNT